MGKKIEQAKTILKTVTTVAAPTAVIVTDIINSTKKKSSDKT